MPAIRSILVAIKDPDAKSLPSINKAAQLARAFRARLELFHGITEPVLTDTYLYANGEFRKLKHETRAKYRERLERLAKPIRAQGIDVRVHAEWDYPAHEAIVRQARRQKCDLIVAECHQGRRLTPWLLHLTDWELLRLSPVPVLLIKNGATWQDINVLAAIDPQHSFAKPAKLDSRILEAASTFADALDGKMHVVHSYVAVPPVAAPIFGGASADALEQIAKGSDLRAKSAFGPAVAPYRLTKQQLHLVRGMPIETIPEVAEKTQSGIVVMGAVSRSGLKRVFIGNTAERLLNKLRCDVLVVKPAPYRGRVQPRRKGMRFAGLPGVSAIY